MRSHSVYDSGAIFVFMSNLTKQIRVNKNGVPVTKHVKVDDTSRSSAVVPRLKLPQSRDVRAKKALRLIAMNSGAARDKAVQKLLELDDQAFARFESLAQMEIDDPTKKYAAEWGLRKIVKEENSEKLLRLLNAAVALHSDDNEEFPNINFMRSLRSIPEFTTYADDFTAAPQDVIQNARNLQRFLISDVRRVDDSSLTRGEATRLTSRELESMVINSPERVQQFVNWTEEYKPHSTTAFPACSSEVILRVIGNPEDRTLIAKIMLEGVADDTKMILALADRRDDHSRIIDLIDSGMKRPEQIIAVLDGDTIQTLSDGYL